MNIDLDEPAFTLRDVADCTSADLKTVDNYVLHNHLTPVRVDGKRRFTPRQMVRVEITARLASLFRIPPSIGTILADGLLSKAAGKLLDEDAVAVGDQSWVAAAAHREQVTFGRDAEGVVTAAAPGDDKTIDIVVPVQLFARQVLAKLAERKLA